MAIPSSMRAVRFFHNDGNGSIKIHDEPVPEPGPKEILVKVRSAGVCHSDLQVFDNPSQIPRPADWSLRPGHEAVGTAVKLGSEVTKFKVGDHLGTLPYLGSCGDCDSCRQVCPLFCPTARVQGFFEDGFVAEYALFGENQALKLPDGMNPETSAPLFCAGLTAFHGVDKAGLSPGQWLAVVGVGGLGTFAVQYALKMGFKVVALDVGQTQLQLAEKLGATAALDSSSPDVAAKVRELTSGGVHAASCFSGSIKAYESAISVIRPAGTLVVVGVTDPKTLPLSAVAVSMGMVKVVGASSGRPEEMERAIEFSHDNNIACIVDARPIDQYQQMVNDMRAGQVAKGRMIVTF